MRELRRALVTSIGLMLVRRRLQRQEGIGAAAALIGLELFGPRVLGVRLRHLLGMVLALTIVGLLVAGLIWWLRRSPAADDETPASEPSAAADPVPPVQPAAPAPAAP
jgi:uncharacterized iron-regulated membrane protein